MIPLTTTATVTETESESKHLSSSEKYSPTLSELIFTQPVEIPHKSHNDLDKAGSVTHILYKSTRVGTIKSKNSPNANKDDNVELVPVALSNVNSPGFHCHTGQDRLEDRRAFRQLSFAFGLTIIFVIGEFAGGYLANSLTIMTDAAHMLSDTGSFAISLFAMQVAKRAASKRFSFGFYRAEVLGALVSIMVIWILTGILVYLAVLRIQTQTFEIESIPMLITASCGVAFNIILGLSLSGVKGHHGHSHALPSFKRKGRSHSAESDAHGHGHSHSNDNAGHGHSHSRDTSGHGHGHSHDSSNKADGHSHDSAKSATNISTNEAQHGHSHEHQGENINVRAAFIHVIGDLVQSIGVLVAAILITFKPEWKLADPICTFIFSVLVLFTTLNVMKDIVRVLMEGTPANVDYDAIKTDLEKIPGVLKAHSLHMWSLTMDKSSASVHLTIVAKNNEALKITEEATKLIREKYNVMFVTVQVEQSDTKTTASCKHCRGPA